MVTDREIQDARRAMRGLDGGKNKKPDLGAYHNWNRKKKLRKRIFIVCAVIAIPMGFAITQETRCFLSLHTDWVKPVEVRRDWEISYGNSGIWQDATPHEECMIELNQRMKHWASDKWDTLASSFLSFSSEQSTEVETSSAHKTASDPRAGTHKVVRVVDGDVELHLKLTQDLHLILTHPGRQIMA